jgi:hypothetical protein
MEDRAPVIGKPTAFLQTGESEKVQILVLQHMRQENNVVYITGCYALKCKSCGQVSVRICTVNVRLLCG